ncbi:MAG: terpene cyclase/mutase family protein [Planctomycetes bacterium]|nr:terpene cyclase/mutase family protein [Planctomycetota bacterium]
MTHLIPQVLIENPTSLNVLLWSGPVVWCVVFIVALRSRWNLSHPLAKWGILSIFAHNILFVYATTVIVAQGSGPQNVLPTVEVSIIEDDGDVPDNVEAQQPRPWQSFATETPELRLQHVELRPLADRPPIERRVDEEIKLPGASSRAEQFLEPAGPPPRGALADAAATQSQSTDAQQIDTVGPQRRDDAPPGQPQPPDPRRLVRRDAAGFSRSAASNDTESELPPRHTFKQRLDESPATRPTAEALAASDELLLKSAAPPTDQAIQDALMVTAAPKIASSRRAGDNGPLPNAYRLRTAPDRGRVVKTRGGDAETEAAVRAALDWLAKVQSRDGRWDPRMHGAGWEPRIDGQDRKGAGARADTAITGLALLAFLGAGHTHLEGDYRDHVKRALEYLLRSQDARDGNLGGRASTFAFMYCHAMATFALCEAYAVTRDERLAAPVRRAVNYTLRAQDPHSGGWRYKAGDPGDTSQLGWQVMVIESAELAGISIPRQTKTGIRRFLKSVSAGERGGLARYQPNKAISRAMTAEALFCHQLIDGGTSAAATKEASDYLLTMPPGAERPNLYYWYYATLAMNQVGGDAWTRWNVSLKRALLPRQRRGGALAGSWDANTQWGAHGGRVYSTALAALSLEVYYRYSPLRTTMRKSRRK